MRITFRYRLFSDWLSVPLEAVSQPQLCGLLFSQCNKKKGPRTSAIPFEFAEKHNTNLRSSTARQTGRRVHPRLRGRFPSRR